MAMVKYAVIKLLGHQYKVSEGETLLIDHLLDKKTEAQVLLVVDGEKVKVGKPIVEKAKVAFKILGDEKGIKMDIYKYKAKSRYRKHIGFRPLYTKIEIGKISS